MEIILLCLYGKVTVIVIFLIIYLYWIWKKVRLIKWEQAPGDTRDWIRNHEKNINKIIKIISGIGLIFMVYCIVIPAILDIPTYFATECKTVNGGLEEQIRGFMREHPDTGLIIIDTLKRVREAGGADYSYASDYDVVARLKALADSYKVSMLIVHHTRKQKSEDIFDMISGTNGLMGAADGAFVLSKDKRTSNNATLDVAGRDQQDMKIHLVRDSERLVWNFAKSETEMWKEPPEPLLEKIADTLFSESDRWEGTASELCERLAVDIKPNVLSLRLSINASRLFRDYGIRYQNSRTHDGRKVSLWKETEQTA